MGRLKKPQTMEDRPGRPRRSTAIQEELLDELRIVVKDCEEGFYGKDNDLDLEAIRDDLNHAMDYAFDLLAGAPFYPASGDDYVLNWWIKKVAEHRKHLELNRESYGMGYADDNDTD
jgi:hypothetical protein